MPEIRPGVDMYANGPGGSWASQRDHAGSAYDSNNQRDAYIVINDSGGKGAFIRRAMFIYDTSSITDTLSSASIDVHGYGTNSLDVILVRAEFVGSIGAGWFNDLKGTDAGTALGNSDGSGAGTLASAGIDYSAEVTTWTTSGVNQIALNSDALANIVADNWLQVIMMGYDYDYLDIEPSGTFTIGNWWDEYGGGTSPTLNYTVATAAVTDNSVFFGCNF